MYFSGALVRYFNPLSPNIYIQTLLIDVHTVLYSISWENLFKDQSNFSLVIISLILITFSADFVLIMVGRNLNVGCSWDLKG